MAYKDKISMDAQIQIWKLQEKGYSVRKIAQVLKMCRRTIRKYIKKQDSAILEKKAVQKIESEDGTIFIPKPGNLNPKEVILQFPEWLQQLDWQTLLSEKKKGVPCTILYEELKLENVKYWSFWKQMSLLEKKLFPKLQPTTMKLMHKPGEKVFVDYGDGIDIINPETGEVTKTWIFVASLPFSSKTYAEFCFDQKLSSFIAAHERMWKFFRGITKYTVCDNLKSAVSKSHIYDPDVNKTFVAYANHAGFAVLPARPRRPKDKANVECHVGILQRSFFQEIRNQQFHTIGELNDALKAFLIRFNNQVMKEYGISRNERFSEEIKHLQELPFNEFILPTVKTATVHPDCHIQHGYCFYSAPYQYVGKEVRVIITNKVEIFDLLTLDRIAVHPLCKKIGDRKTNNLHWPPEKKAHCDFTIERARQDAKKIGPHTAEMFEYLFSLPHPLIYLRRAQGWIRLISTARCTKDALEYASKMALQHSKFNSSYVNDCAKYYDIHGLKNTQETTSPNRNLNHLYLQK